MNKTKWHDMEITPPTRRKVSTQIDLTAMVDLGFLLITFFMLASSFVKPRTMEVIKPSDGPQNPYPESKTATIVIGTRDKVYTYTLPDKIIDLAEFKFDSTDFSPDGLRKYIQRRQSEVKLRYGDQNELMVIIKPLPGTPYKNMVDVLDEMLINNVQRYAIVKPSTIIDSLIVKETGESW